MTASLALSELAHHTFVLAPGGASIARESGEDAEQAFGDLLWGACQGARVKTSGDRRHAFLLAFWPFVNRDVGCAGWLDYGNALVKIDGCHQNRAGGGRRRTLAVKASKSCAASGRICSRLPLETDTPT